MSLLFHIAKSTNYSQFVSSLFLKNAARGPAVLQVPETRRCPAVPRLRALRLGSTALQAREMLAGEFLRSRRRNSRVLFHPRSVTKLILWNAILILNTC